MAAVDAPARSVALVSAFPLGVGGVETHLLSLLSRSASSSYRWCVVAPVSAGFAARARASEAHVTPWRPAHILDATALVRLVRLLSSHDVDLVHVHDPRGAVFCRVAACLLRIPVVVTVHLPPYHYVYGTGLCAHWKRGFYRTVERVLNHWATDRLIYVSHCTYEEALALGVAPPARAKVIENGIDLSRYAGSAAGRCDLRKGLAVPAGARVLCFVGRLDYQKGLDVLLEAVHRLRPRGEAWRVWLIGDGPQRADLEAQTRRLGLRPLVRFLGFRDDVPDLLGASDIFVLPSRYEAMPMAILEAMAAGLPMVVTDVGENARLVKDQSTGLVVPAENPVALAAALDKLLVAPERCKQMGRAARCQAETYSDVRMVQRTLEVYASALDRRAPSGAESLELPAGEPRLPPQ